MGGIGSGRWQTPTHGTVEEARLALDVRELKRAGALCPGRTADVSACGHGLQVQASEDAVEIRGRASSPAIAEHVDIHRTECFFGGDRPWFGCPGCGRRVAILYLHRTGPRLRCRTCLGLKYQSQRLTEPERLERRAAKLYKRAGTSPWASFHYKPRWMRWETFHGLIDEAEACVDFGLVLATANDAFTRRFCPEVHALVREYRGARKAPAVL